MKNNPSKPHIMILCSRLNLPGGVERSVTNLANLFFSNGHPVTILVLDEAAASFYPLHAGIKILQENLHLGITKKGNPLSRKFALTMHLFRLRKLIRQENPAFILSSDYSFTIAAWLASRGLKTKLISREAHHFFWLKRNRFWETLFQRIYPRVDAIVALNEDEANYYTRMGCKTEVIPNFIDVQVPVNDTQRKKIILSIGWIIHRKGFDLIPAIANEALAGVDWRW